MRPDMIYQAFDVNTSVKNATITDLANRNESIHKLNSSKVLALH